MKKLLISIFTIFLLVGCTGEVDYIQDFTNGKGIRYAGIVDTVYSYTGKNRLQINFVLGPDPSLNKTIIYWNLKNDSIVINYDRGQLKSDTLSRVIENLPENTYSFEVYNFDEFGNASVPKHLTAKTYGDKYISGLYNRVVKEEVTYSYDEEKFLISLSDTVLNTVGINFEYTNSSNEKKTVFVDNKTNILKLGDINLDIPIQCYTLYVPEVNSIDTFIANPTSYKLERSKESVMIPKPYGYIILEGDYVLPDDPKMRWEYLWDGEWMSGYGKYGELDYRNFQAGSGSTGSNHVWVTIDLGKKYKISRFRGDFYWYMEGAFPRILDLMAYTGDGVPPNLPKGTGNGDDAYWKDWEILHTFNSDAVPGLYPPKSDEGFNRGYDTNFGEDTSVAQYYRLRCRYSYRDTYKIFSLAEATFWYME